jgi:hypothetical protein
MLYNLIVPPRQSVPKFTAIQTLFFISFYQFDFAYSPAFDLDSRYLKH